jgi:hypothetical protein
MKKSTAHNVEWDWADSPYNYPPMESDVCACDSRLCVDCSPDRLTSAEQARTERATAIADAAIARGEPMIRSFIAGPSYSPWHFRLLLTYYRLKRWILKRLGR